MDVIIGLAYLGAMIVCLVVCGRGVVRHLRQVPARLERAPDQRVLRYRFVRVVVGLALVIGFLRFVGHACADEPGFSRGIVVPWEYAGLAALVAAVLAPLVVRRVSGDAWATSSLVLPVVGIALLLPLTLHYAAFRIAGERAMDEWCVAGLVIAAVPHIVFALLFSARTVSLARTGASTLAVGELFALTTLAGALPGFIFGMGLVALTGVFFLPVISLVDWLAVREHAATAAGLPRAIVAPCRA